MRRLHCAAPAREYSKHNSSVAAGSRISITAGSAYLMSKESFGVFSNAEPALQGGANDVFPKSGQSEPPAIGAVDSGNDSFDPFGIAALSQSATVRVSPMAEEEVKKAAEEGDLTQLQALLQKNATVIHFKTVKKRSLLHITCARGYLDMTKYLVECGLDVNTSDMYGVTPLHSACLNGQAEIVRFLTQDVEANMQAQNAQGDTPLHFACSTGQVAVVRLLTTDDLDPGRVTETLRVQNKNTKAKKQYLHMGQQHHQNYHDHYCYVK